MTWLVAMSGASSARTTKSRAVHFRLHAGKGDLFDDDIYTGILKLGASVGIFHPHQNLSLANLHAFANRYLLDDAAFEMLDDLVVHDGSARPLRV